MTKSDEVILKVENLSKQYRLGLVGTGTLSHDLNRWWHRVRGKEDPYLKIGETNDRSQKGESEYVWALKDINFEVKRGEVLGIIGKNGAGKSTLLKILSKVTSPTTGSVKTRGRIASLLEVGTGFHGEMTGRENIYLNGAILGMTKKEIASKIDEIIDFSGCARYIDTPVKRYSSGMTVRLAFAVAAFLEPDILIVDEVLAVGDAEFQKKAIGKMQDISSGEGRTVLFVSHNMTAIQSLTKKVILLDEGQIYFHGITHVALERYSEIQAVNKRKSFKAVIFNDVLKILSIEVLQNSKLKTQFTHNDKIAIHIRYCFLKPMDNMVFSIRVIDNNNNIIFTSWDSDNGIRRSEFINQEYILTAIIPPRLLKMGQYNVSIAAHIPRKESIFQFHDILSFEISSIGYKINNRQGLIMPILSWTLSSINDQSHGLKS